MSTKFFFSIILAVIVFGQGVFSAPETRSNIYSGLLWACLSRVDERGSHLKGKVVSANEMACIWSGNQVFGSENIPGREFPAASFVGRLVAPRSTKVAFVRSIQMSTLLWLQIPSFTYVSEESESLRKLRHVEHPLAACRDGESTFG
ncbi:hypothetical protein K438DRAFT_1757983 [Mycena galopus ATCC 62051]|nr:hypothetical protein K438DRAFT_1757983 [Mycena galopus ATCC 62051]